MTDIHSCSYYCDRPECIKAQRDELRAALEAQPVEPVAYIWHQHLGEKSQSLRWARPNQWEYATKVEPLYAAPPAPAAVPPGFALVPIEPTPDMVAAGTRADFGAASHITAPIIYRAMIAAAGDKP